MKKLDALVFHTLCEKNKENYISIATSLFQGREEITHFSRISLSYLPSPPLGQDMTQGQFLSGV